jgi:aryl-phospho-beta-D-glucosidase BglC (GH1 family)
MTVVSSSAPYSSVNAARFFLKSVIKVLATLSLVAAFANVSVGRAQLIDVNFTQNSSPGTGGPNPGPTMSGPAVLGSAGDHWNGINGANGSGISLFYSDGSPSPVTLSFTSGGGYNVYDYGGTTPFTGTPWQSLTETYLYNSGMPQTIALSGLPANSLYNVAIYNAADTPAAGRTTYFTINGCTLGSTWNGSSNTFIPGIDFVFFPSVISSASGTLAVTYTGNGTAEGDVDGFQIEAAPLTINASSTATNVFISFMTRYWYRYQLQYKIKLTDSVWTSTGIPVRGNDSTLSLPDALSGATRFYRVQLSTIPSAFTLLHARGTAIVNTNNEVVQLKGLNLGGWFVMEPWMCPADSGGLPDTYSIIQELDSRFGVATEQLLIQTYQSSWITTNDLDNITNGGFNCVRVPLWWGNFYSITNTTSTGWRPDAFAELDWLVTNCASRGIYVVIDMHGVVGSQSTSDDTGQQNLNAYWTNSLDQGETAYMWSQIASHYCTNSAVAGYDLINEPDDAPNTAAVWSAYDSLYHIIRAIDTNHVIIMEGTFGNWDWDMLPNPTAYGWTNIVYSMHEYQFGGTVAQIEAGSDNQVADFNFHKSWNVPGYIGEWNDMGQGAACYDYSINDYNNAGMSWTMWAYKAAAGLLPDGWGWYDPIAWPATPNISTDSALTISNDWSQWKTTSSFGINAAVGL